MNSHISKTFCILAIGLLASAAVADTARAPMDWSPVRTNDIARWKAERKAPDGVLVDRASRTVTFLMEATGISLSEPTEFFAIGPLSDRSYESFGVTVASPAAIAAAVESIGVPQGVAIDPFLARMWPQGERLVLTATPYGATNAAPLALSDILDDKLAKEEGAILAQPLVYTGGARDAANRLLAATNIPCAVFALYGHGPSMLQLDGRFDQSSTYGRFAAKKAFPAGTLLEMRLAWDGTTRVKARTPTITADNAGDVLRSLKADATPGSDLFVSPSFDASVNLARAIEVAKAFEALDGVALKMNGAPDGQFFYKAFLPDPAWRDRKGRLFQPFEIRLAADGARSFTFVEEDWSGDGIDPVLKPKTTSFKEWSELPGIIAKTGEQGSKIMVMFIYAPKGARVADLTPAIGAVFPRVNTFYVFGE